MPAQNTEISNKSLYLEDNDWPQDARRDRLIGDWYIYQRKGGHRTSTDDLITAWYAVHRQPKAPLRYLDLGCGIGSVMLMLSHKLRPALVHGVEAQAQSVRMARRTISELPDHDCHFEIFHADFRALQLKKHSYPLITASPPYFPLSDGTPSKDPQRRACRFETRGGVEAYMQAADLAMSANGHLYLVFQTRWTARVLRAAQAFDLQLTGQVDFLMRSDRPDPFLSVYEFSRQACETIDRQRRAVRTAQGEISADYHRLRQELGLD